MILRRKALPLGRRCMQSPLLYMYCLACFWLWSLSSMAQAQPNFVIDSFGFNGTHITRGQSLRFYTSVRISNKGTTPSPATILEFVISSTPLSAPADSRGLESAGAINIASIDPGAFINVDIPVSESFVLFDHNQTPQPLCGNVYLTAFVNRDASVQETSMTDNYISKFTEMFCHPRLKITQFDLIGSVFSHGTNISPRLTLVVFNNGTIPPSGVTAKFSYYYSADAAYQTTDAVFGEFNLPTINPGSSLQLVAGPMYLPYGKGCGAQNLIIFLDPSNVYGGPFPQNERIMVRPIFVPCTSTNSSATPVYDLRVINFTMPLNSSGTLSNLTFRPDQFLDRNILENIISYVINDGSSMMHPSYSTGFYLSPNSVIDPTQDFYIQGSRTRNLRTLFATDSFNFWMPVSSFVSSALFDASVQGYPCGSMYLGLYLDEFNEIIEYDESNNFMSLPINIECCPFSSPEICASYGCSMKRSPLEDPGCCDNIVSHCGTADAEVGCDFFPFRACFAAVTTTTAPTTTTSTTSSTTTSTGVCTYETESRFSPCALSECNSVYLISYKEGYNISMDCCNLVRLYCGRHPSDDGCLMPLNILSIYPCSQNRTFAYNVLARVESNETFSNSSSELNELSSMISSFVDVDVSLVGLRFVESFSSPSYYALLVSIDEDNAGFIRDILLEAQSSSTPMDAYWLSLVKKSTFKDDNMFFSNIRIVDASASTSTATKG